MRSNRENRSVRQGEAFAGRHRPTIVHAGFSLVELLVTIGIIGVLAGLLLPAIQSSRETAKRNACGNRLRQLGIAALHHEAVYGHFPSGSMAKPSPDNPTAPWSFYRWSTLAQLMPFMENSSIYDMLDITVPLYGSTLGPRPENEEMVRLIVPEFLCPSDATRRISEWFGPTNYVVSTGSGSDGGSPMQTDGVFAVNSETRVAQITDGTSKTALMSESMLGRPSEASHDAQYDYKFVALAPLTENICRLTNQWNFTDPRGFSWANGEYRCAMYNHARTPNSMVSDCMGVVAFGPPEIKYTPYGWRAARSLHPGGVNVLWADGSLRFVPDAVDLEVWQELSTIAGNQ